MSRTVIDDAEQTARCCPLAEQIVCQSGLGADRGCVRRAADREGRMSEVRDVFRFIDLLTGYQPAMAIMAAVRLGLFDALDTEPKTAGVIAGELDADPEALGALLRALAAVGIVGRDADRYSATPFTGEHLAGSHDLALVVRKEEYFARAWLSLAEAVGSGRPVLPPWGELLAGDPPTAHMFLDALNVLAERTGPRLWELPELAPRRRVLDVGGGFGHYARRLVAAGSTVVLVDLPGVVAAAEERLSDLPPTAFQMVAADVTVADACGVAPGSFDAALVSHMLHDRSPEMGIDLLRRAGDAVVSGGHVVVNDFAGEVGPGPFGPMFDVMMRVETGGAAHPLDTLLGMLDAAGLTEVRVVDLPEPLTVLVGRRP